MKKILKEYQRELKVILAILIASILFVELSFIAKSVSFTGEDKVNQLIVSVIMILVDIMIFTITDMIIMKKVKDDKKINWKEFIEQYPKVVLVNAAIAFITYELGYAIVLANNSYAQTHTSGTSLIFIGLTSVFLYLVKMFLSFAPHEVCLNNQKIDEALVRSIKIVWKNLGRVVMYNVVFIALAYVVMNWNNYYIETYGMAPIYNIMNEVTTNAIFATNTLLYVNIILQRKKTRKKLGK